MQQELKLTPSYVYVKINDFYFVICVLCYLASFPSASFMAFHSKIKHKGKLMPPECVSENSDKNSSNMQSLCT